MATQNIQLKIGDEIGFVSHAGDVDSTDQIIFFPVVKIIIRGGENAYFYQYPDGEMNRSAIRQSALSSHVVRVNQKTVIQPLQTAAPKPAEMICLSSRKKEFVEAMSRADNSDLEVFADWERDSFVVVNHGNGKEYRVELDSNDGRAFAQCDCPDFVYRSRICKHISSVLADTVFGVPSKN